MAANASAPLEPPREDREFLRDDVDLKCRCWSLIEHLEIGIAQALEFASAIESLKRFDGCTVHSPDVARWPNHDERRRLLFGRPSNSTTRSTHRRWRVRVLGLARAGVDC